MGGHTQGEERRDGKFAQKTAVTSLRVIADDVRECPRGEHDDSHDGVANREIPRQAVRVEAYVEVEITDPNKIDKRTLFERESRNYGSLFT